MMVFSSRALVLCFLIMTVNAFTSPRLLSRTANGAIFASSSSFPDDNDEQIREELIAKYVQLGKDEAIAQEEVDRFLSDPELSQKYLEMREYAKSQADLVGPDLYLEVGGYFMLGLLGTVALKYWDAYRHLDTLMPPQ